MQADGSDCSIYKKGLERLDNDLPIAQSFVVQVLRIKPTIILIVKINGHFYNPLYPLNSVLVLD